MVLLYTTTRLLHAGTRKVNWRNSLNGGAHLAGEFFDALVLRIGKRLFAPEGGAPRAHPRRGCARGRANSPCRNQSKLPIPSANQLAPVQQTRNRVERVRGKAESWASERERLCYTYFRSNGLGGGGAIRSRANRRSATRSGPLGRGSFRCASLAPLRRTLGRPACVTLVLFALRAEVHQFPIGKKRDLISRAPYGRQ